MRSSHDGRGRGHRASRRRTSPVGEDPRDRGRKDPSQEAAGRADRHAATACTSVDLHFPVRREKCEIPVWQVTLGATKANGRHARPYPDRSAAPTACPSTSGKARCRTVPSWPWKSSTAVSEKYPAVLRDPSTAISCITRPRWPALCVEKIRRRPHQRPSRRDASRKGQPHAGRGRRPGEVGSGRRGGARSSSPATTTSKRTTRC